MDLPPQYDSDFVGWTERQAALLRALPPGSHGLDTGMLAEEVEDLGKAEIRAASSLLRQVLIHLIKLAREPDAPAASHWHTETLTFQADAAAAASSGVRQRIELSKIWLTARKAAVGAGSQMTTEMTLPEACPFSLGELLADEFDPIPLTRRLQPIETKSD